MGKENTSTSFPRSFPHALTAARAHTRSEARSSRIVIDTAAVDPSPLTPLAPEHAGTNYCSGDPLVSTRCIIIGCPLRHLDRVVERGLPERVPDKVVLCFEEFVHSVIAMPRAQMRPLVLYLSTHLNVRLQQKGSAAVVPFLYTVLNYLQYMRVSDMPASFRPCLAHVLRSVDVSQSPSKITVPPTVEAGATGPRLPLPQSYLVSADSSSWETD
eukprot:Rhum_TRINITY_DN14870_c18_g1::Rhum_TRINITY_DN14870_c18_g1_i1::g.126300::m.126300